MESLIVNIAPTSSTGHFVHKAKRVVELDKAAETFFVESGSELVTKNHHTLTTHEPRLITCQRVKNAFSGLYQNVLD
jgi:hypothetical protein